MLGYSTIRLRSTFITIFSVNGDPQYSENRDIKKHTCSYFVDSGVFSPTGTGI